VRPLPLLLFLLLASLRSGAAIRFPWLLSEERDETFARYHCFFPPQPLTASPTPGTYEDHADPAAAATCTTTGISGMSLADESMTTSDKATNATNWQSKVAFRLCPRSALPASPPEMLRWHGTCTEYSWDLAPVAVSW
jgi:hypothetical protein